ncbi:hypothetical protein [Spirosoma sp. KNUC1025]|uniref:hypothetical protein n=1 Tax=Spirosoma sp. KNUC1025 TaxID=2894082 RepID=UPI0038686DC0|nr:hypothetical protein LN737_05125 [Spirosoma sp. KNUC1025]
MKIPRRVWLLLLLSNGCSTPHPQHSNSNLIISDSRFRNKSFTTQINEAALTDEKELSIQTVFSQDSTGYFRIASASKTDQVDFTWQFIGDSLSIREKYRTDYQADSIPSVYESSATLYSVTEEASGYLLKNNQGQILLLDN